MQPTSGHMYIRAMVRARTSAGTMHGGIPNIVIRMDTVIPIRIGTTVILLTGDIAIITIIIGLGDGKGLALGWNGPKFLARSLGPFYSYAKWP